jgi:hypothetical protein
MKLTVYSKVVVTQPVNTPNQSFALNTYMVYEINYWNDR